MAGSDWTGFILSPNRKASPVTAMEHVHRYVEPYLGGEAA